MSQVLLELGFRTTGTGEARRLRKGGVVPGILYGARADAAPVLTAERALEQALARGAGHRPFLTRLADRGQGRELLVLMKELQRDRLTQKPVHFDLLAVARDKPVTASLPLHLLGEERLQRSGLLIHFQMREIALEALPEQIPGQIEVAVGDLVAGAAVTVADLQVPDGVTVLMPPDQVVLTVAEPRVQAGEEEAPRAEAAATAEPGAAHAAEESE